MNLDDEKRPAPGPGDLDPGAIVAISLKRDAVTFASYDRLSHVMISGNQLRRLRERMTHSERRELDRKVKNRLCPTSFGEISFATPTAATAPKFTVPEPEPTVSETLAAQAASGSGPAASAKAVMNALTKMGATSDDALAIILAEIAASDDPFKVSGDWIAKITNAANAVVKEVESDEQ